MGLRSVETAAMTVGRSTTRVRFFAVGYNVRQDGQAARNHSANRFARARVRSEYRFVEALTDLEALGRWRDRFVDVSRHAGI